MKESHEKNLASHLDPESCGAAREGGLEVLTGENADEPLSREIRTADAVKRSGRPHPGARKGERPGDSARSQTLCMHGHFMDGNWDIPGLSES